jgi:hypothetical protein
MVMVLMEIVVLQVVLLLEHLVILQMMGQIFLLVMSLGVNNIV